MRSWSQSIAVQAPCFANGFSLRWIGGGIALVGLLWFIIIHPFFDRGRHPEPPVHDFGPPHPPENSHSLPLPLPEPSESASWPQQTRADAVRDAFLHAFDGYATHAWGFDELRPVSGGRADTLNGWAVTLIDALDTLWIMGLHHQFHEAVPTVAKMSFLTENKFAPFFETVIRVLGGLLSAYALSGEPILLSRADDLGRALLPAFNTTSGLPMFSVNTATGVTRQGWTVDALWSEMTSCQLEYKYLAHLTGRTDYYHRAEHVMDIMYEWPATDGLYPTLWSRKGATPINNMESAKGIIENLLYLSPRRKLLYVTDIDKGFPSRTLEHLSCFLPGLFALGAKTVDMPSAERELHEWAARGLAYTCYIIYADQPSALGPDEIVVDPWPPGQTDGNPLFAGRWVDHVNVWMEEGRPGGVPPGLHEPPPVIDGGALDYRIKRPDYLLRPEVVESLYLMWRTTGDELWKERGWEIFLAIEKHCRTDYGFASVRGVGLNEPKKIDEMPSFFLAETLKYLYLLFVDEDIVPLDKWVLNTEAHPLPVFEWTKWEKAEYNISL
ncbi:hypothetical protein ID866_3362 [Astraeus odoratus]|nr:hypothetical protein ID866_3362 [Astraeus odoratus]